MKRANVGGGLSERGASRDDNHMASKAPARQVSDLNLTGIVRHKEEVSEEVAAKTRELERLRHKQEDLERQKRSLEELRQKQDDYVRGKSEMTERLSQTVVTLEKQVVRAAQMVDLLTDARTRFKDFKAEIDALDEDSWPEDTFREELGKALTIIDNARMDYNKTMAKIESATNSGESMKQTRAALFENAEQQVAEEKTFLDWVKIGLAISLPVVLVWLLMLVLLVVALARGGWLD